LSRDLEGLICTLEQVGICLPIVCHLAVDARIRFQTSDGLLFRCQLVKSRRGGSGPRGRFLMLLGQFAGKIAIRLERQRRRDFCRQFFTRSIFTQNIFTGSSGCLAFYREVRGCCRCGCGRFLRDHRSKVGTPLVVKRYRRADYHDACRQRTPTQDGPGQPPGSRCDCRRC